MLTAAAVASNANNTDATFKITDVKLYVPIVTLSAEDNAKLSKLLSKGLKRSVYWNKYKVIDNTVVEMAANNEEEYIKKIASLKLSRSRKIICSCL